MAPNRLIHFFEAFFSDIMLPLNILVLAQYVWQSVEI
jgi:hypothetical protein